VVPGRPDPASGADPRRRHREDVSLVETGEAGEQVDAAYRTKYGPHYPTIVPSIAAPAARAATLKLVPREEET